MHVNDLLQTDFYNLQLGREKELTALMSILSFEKEWKYAHIYAPGGLGKTTLLNLLARRIDENRCILFGGFNQAYSPQEWLVQLNSLLDRVARVEDMRIEQSNPAVHLTAVLQRLNRIADELGGLVLLFDTFEQWGPIEDWLRSEFLPKLVSRVKVCSAGRYPLEGAWGRGGWKRLVHNFRLYPLSNSDLDSYALSCGIQDPGIRVKIQKFTGGIPLAVSLAVEIIQRKSTPDFLNDIEQQDTIEYLMKELLRDLNHPFCQSYLDVVSVLWRFNQEWLQELLEEPVSTDMFREFCRLPIIVSSQDGWGLHDAIRNWARADFLRRKPNTLEAYRLKALEKIRIEEQQQPAVKSTFALDKLYLHENDLVRHYCFGGEVNGYALSNCQEQDLPSLEKIYLDFNRANGLLTSGMVGFQPLIRPLWLSDPSGFYGVWKNDALVAFYTFIHLNERTLPILANCSVAVPFLTKTERMGQEYAILFVGILPEWAEKAGGALMHLMVNPLNKAKIVYNLSPYKEWYPVLEQIGFERIPWADSISSEGTKFQGFRLDLREEDFPAKIDRLFFTPHQARTRMAPKLETDQAYLLAKELLIHYHRLPELPEVVAKFQHFCTISAVKPDYIELALHLQHRTEQCLKQLDQGTSADQTSAQQLRLAYIKKIGSHETVAERLNMPQATYYRQLKKATSRLAALLLTLV